MNTAYLERNSMSNRTTIENFSSAIDHLTNTD